MSEFKVGDRVVCKDYSRFYGVGAEGTVVKLAKDGTTAVKFTSGVFNTNLQRSNGHIWVINTHLALARPRYSASFTQQTSGVGFGDFLASGHEDNGGGLQKHSIGDFYPWLVVGYGYGNIVLFCIQNMQTGETLGDKAERVSVARQWVSCSDAYAYLTRYHSGLNCLTVDRIVGKVEIYGGQLHIIS
jgi:hypothetical protein